METQIEVNLGQIVTVFVRKGIGNDLGTNLCLFGAFSCLLRWTKHK
jgi:hypothetical protein